MRNDIYNRMMEEPYPCQHCEWASKCAKYELACDRFLHYINEKRWVNEPQKVPTGKLYEFIFNSDNEDLMKAYLARKLGKNAT